MGRQVAAKGASRVTRTTTAENLEVGKAEDQSYGEGEGDEANASKSGPFEEEGNMDP